MTLKLKITKAEHDALPDPVKGEYKAAGDDFTLDVDGYEDPAELRRARDREKLASKAEKDRADALQLQIDEGKENNSKRRGDIDALEKSWKEKNEKLERDAAEKVKSRETQVRKLLVDNVAVQLANKISTVPELLLPHVKARLEVDFEGDEPKTRVIGADGKPTALTVAELEREFVDNKTFAAIIRASNASGGGAAGNQGGGATKAFKDMGDKERVELYRTDPERFKRESAAAKAAVTQT